MPFNVKRIVFSTNFKGSKSKNQCQISIYGMVNNKNETIHHNVASIEEIVYYTKVLKNKYKKILLFENLYKVGSKNYTDTSIVVEY